MTIPNADSPLARRPPSPHPLPDSTVAETLAAWPELAAVFLNRRMACPGCAMAPFMTLREAARSYGIEEAALLGDLETALAGCPPRGPFAPPLPHGTAAAP